MSRGSMIEWFWLLWYKLQSRLFMINRQVDSRYQGYQFEEYVQYHNQEANDYILDCLREGAPVLIAKFGTNELNIISRYHKAVIDEGKEFIKEPYKEEMRLLSSAAGFFPDDIDLLPDFYREYLAAMREIDILGSYQQNESVFAAELSNATRVNLDGYYAPFYWRHPWTSCLKGKRVLVVHPFAEEIEKQYRRRKQLWRTSDILPEFTLITYKSIQSMLGSCTGHDNWFDALDFMTQEIAQLDFDIALVGCGAYGLPLSARIKKMGKQVIHLAGWTQILFGIIGTRWENNPRIAVRMNRYWIRPSEQNRPQNAKEIENGCYW